MHNSAHVSTQADPNLLFGARLCKFLCTNVHSGACQCTDKCSTFVHECTLTCTIMCTNEPWYAPLCHLVHNRMHMCAPMCINVHFRTKWLWASFSTNVGVCVHKCTQAHAHLCTYVQGNVHLAAHVCNTTMSTNVYICAQLCVTWCKNVYTCASKGAQVCTHVCQCVRKSHLEHTCVHILLLDFIITRSPRRCTFEQSCWCRTFGFQFLALKEGHSTHQESRLLSCLTHQLVWLHIRAQNWG